MNDDHKILKHKLQTLLRDNIVDVSFTKVDGTLRTMKCTLKGSIVPYPTKEWSEHVSNKLVPENVLPVWDTEKNAWRSFRVDSVHDYMIVKLEV